MEQIRLLCKLNKEELLGELVEQSKKAFEDGVYADEDIDDYLDTIDNIIYVLRNCEYVRDEEEE